MDLEKIIGSNIRRLREARGWKQRQVADLYSQITGESCDARYISLVETGRKWLGKNSFYRFVELFNVEPDELILPPAGNLRFLLWEKVSFIMKVPEIRQLFMQSVDIFLNYKYINTVAWATFAQ